jgi:hypothetical protein
MLILDVELTFTKIVLPCSHSSILVLITVWRPLRNVVIATFKFMW